MTTDNDNAAEVHRIKSQIDKLREQWDRLDAHGSQATKQTEIRGQIEGLQRRLKELTGEDY